MQQKAMNTTSVVFWCYLALAWLSSVEAAGLVKHRTSLKKIHPDVASKGSEAKVNTDDQDDDDDDEESDDDDDKQEKVLTKDVSLAQVALDKNLEDQKDLQTTINHLKDKKASDKEIDADAEMVAKETQSRALGDMMGNMWKELRLFEVPAYAAHVEGDIAIDMKTERALKAKLGKAKTSLIDLNKEWAAEDQPGFRQPGTKPTPADAKSGPRQKVIEVEAPATDSDTPEIPTTARCIVIMVCQYMIVHTALALCRTYHELTGTARGIAEKGLGAAAQTLTYGPMLCVLFIACRMRVEFLSDGKDEPQMWVQHCMYALTFAVIASTLLVLVMPIVTGETPRFHHDAPGRHDSSCTYDVETPTGMGSRRGRNFNQTSFYVLTVVRYVILLCLYGGIAGVIVGIFTYTPPGQSDLSKLPAPAPAVMCTMILSILFFIFQLLIAVGNTYVHITGSEIPVIRETLSNAADTVEFAPQLAILFLAARMRALQHDGQPQEWAQSCMFSSTIALCLTATLACLVPVVMGGTMRTHPINRETTFEVPNPMIGVGLVALRFLCMVYFYGGAIGVIYSIFTFESPKGPEHTLPVSPTVHCVINLTCQFFSVYFIQTIMLMVSEISNGTIRSEDYKLFTALESAKSSLAFAPMLSIMFVTIRMYALLITDKKGAPQAWVQDGMYMATWSLLITFLASLCTGLVLDRVETDEDGNVINKFSNRWVAFAMLFVRYFSMILLYGGIATCIVGLFLMTPETANGRGSVPVVTDVVSHTPMGHAPPSAGDISNAGKEAAGAATSK